MNKISSKYGNSKYIIKNHKIAHHVYLIHHGYQFLEIAKPPRLYHPARQFDTSEYLIYLEIFQQNKYHEL